MSYDERLEYETRILESEMAAIRLERLLNLRDKFIVECDLWSEFVEFIRLDELESKGS